MQEKKQFADRRHTLRRYFTLWMFCTLWLPAFAAAQEVASAATSPIHTGIYRGRCVTYMEMNGLAIYEGDIILGTVAEMEDAANQFATQGIGIAYPSYLWPQVGGLFQVPYVVTGAPGNVAAAIAAFNDTFNGLIQFVPRTTETDYVNFNLDADRGGGVCFSSEGRAGGMQSISGSVSCTTATLLHEMGHTIGLWHEQSRADRDTYVNVQYNNVIKGSRAEFDQLLDNAQSIGLYDYRSVMHYDALGFTWNGEPTIESIPAGIPLSNTVGYSESDIDSILRLYNAAPTDVTITSNPPGLQVIVDGQTITTPQSFTFDLNSTHTLDVPAGSQTLSGTTYIYGRWNDNVARSHTITIAPGSGLLTAPVTSPAVTVYTANFIELVPFTQSVTPPNGGRMTASPPPASYPPADGLFYVARQAVTLQATPSAGYNSYRWLWLGPPGPSGSNPKVVRAPRNVTAEFTTAPVTTITTNPPGRWIWVDGSFYYGPQNFVWTAGSSHNLNIMISSQSPYSINTRYRFAGWSDGGAQSHNITVPAGSSTVTANFTPQYAPVVYTNPRYPEGCAGSISVAPTSPDGYYDNGTQLTFRQTPSAGWLFTGWQGDLTGTGNPQSLTVNDEVLVQADYNTTTVPLSITDLDPPIALAGDNGFTLTINGTGFTGNSLASVRGPYRATTFVNSTQLTVEISADDIATAGAFQVGVWNFPPGARCAAFTVRTFFIVDAGSAAAP